MQVAEGFTAEDTKLLPIIDRGEGGMADYVNLFDLRVWPSLKHLLFRLTERVTEALLLSVACP